MNNKIHIQASIAADRQKAWDAYTLPEHITKWNFASPDWHCPSARNDMRPGGTYAARMEAKDGSFGFDFEAVYTNVQEGKGFSYKLGDQRAVDVHFTEAGGQTVVDVYFDPENQNPQEMQQQGWQAILNNYKAYTESL
ncbi:MAG: SRPBCC family protein [Chitinophagaceae bacterium]